MDNNAAGSEYAIEMIGITKSFPGIVANDNISLRLRKGEIHALLGENGAGKTTLMSILFGMHKPDEGIIKKDGQIVKINTPNEASALGIGMVHQHFMLVECFTVLENIILGTEPVKMGFLKKREALARVRALSEKYGLNIDPEAKIRDITVGMQQRTEILKVLYRNNDILIFDEPTAVLTAQEISELIQIMKNLASEGKSILFISHKLPEIMAAADRCTVLRKGRYIGTVNIADTTVNQLTSMMVGRNVCFHIEKKESVPGKTVLHIEGMTVADRIRKRNAVRDVSITVREGEIVGVAGIDGNGQMEFVRALTGFDSLVSGSIFLDGKDVTGQSIRARSQLGLTHIPEDRHKYGMVLDYSLEENLILQQYYEPEYTNRFGFIRQRNIRKHADEMIERFDIRSGQGPDTVARSMSGGNQQKAIVARELERDLRLIVSVQPTRGLDIGAIENIHRQIISKRDSGKAVLLISLDMDEIIDLSDRILVMYDGEIVARLDPKKTSAEELGLYMTGAKRMKLDPEDI